MNTESLDRARPPAAERSTHLLAPGLAHASTGDYYWRKVCFGRLERVQIVSGVEDGKTVIALVAKLPLLWMLEVIEATDLIAELPPAWRPQWYKPWTW